MSDETLAASLADGQEGHGVRFLDPTELTFLRSPGGVLRLTLPDRSYRQVTITCSQPLSAPEEYLSLASGEQEIGIVRRLADLSAEQQELVRAELDRRYFQPVIEKVVAVTDNLGAYHWEVVTDRGPAEFEAQHPRHSVMRVEDGRWLIRAADQNRYEIRNLNSMDRRSQKILLEVLI